MAQKPAAAPSTPGPGGGDSRPLGGAPTVAPVRASALTALRLPATVRRPAALRVRFTLRAAADVRLAVCPRGGGRCVRRTVRRPAGPGKLKVGTRRLRPGRYVVRIVADAGRPVVRKLRIR
jgi:hypothetical protein